MFQVSQKTFKVQCEERPLINRTDNDNLKTCRAFVDTVVFSTIVSKKIIEEENLDRIKQDL